MADTLVLGGHEFQSRFILGSGKYNMKLIKAAVEQGGAQIITLALRRANTQEKESILDFIPEGVTLLPNTSGARNAEEAIRIARLSRAMDWLTDGHVPDPNGMLQELHDAILKGASWHKPDHYYICLDFEPYMEAKLRANREYRDRMAFARKCLVNAANAGSFSSDRTIREYARDIWRTE